MPRRIAVSNLNASTIDILNVIRQNASLQYQELVPEVAQANDIPRVGEVIYGYPALANEFVSALVNRIAMVRVKSATFNNDYAELKKGYLEFGETVEEVFVGICKAREFSAEKAESREFKRSLPDVRSAFHILNYKAQYPITIQDEDLRMAFTSITGVQDLIAKIVDAVYVSAEYDEYLLFKYLMIKAIAHGKMYPVALGADMKSAAVAFRGASNQLTFMGKKFNESNVTTTTPKADQYIFMDSQYNAQYDVNVLAGAFNMDKADFMGKLKLIDDWTTFDNDRFSQIIEATDALEAVTDDELALMADVKAVLIDKEWFQVYDNLNKMSEKYVASGLYWNYFYNVWKTVSSSPFSNAIVFVDGDASIDPPATLTVEIASKSDGENATVFTLGIDEDDASLANMGVNFIQTAEAVENGVAVHKYGAYMFTPNANSVYVEAEINGVYYKSTAKLATTDDVGDTLTLAQVGYIENTLSALTLKDADSANVTLTPSFDKNTLTYAGSDVDTATVTVTATPKDEDATVSIECGGETYDSGDAVTLTAGTNVITIKVSGTTLNTYKVTIKYEE